MRRSMLTAKSPIPFALGQTDTQLAVTPNNLVFCYTTYQQFTDPLPPSGSGFATGVKFRNSSGTAITFAIFTVRDSLWTVRDVTANLSGTSSSALQTVTFATPLAIGAGDWVGWWSGDSNSFPYNTTSAGNVPTYSSPAFGSAQVKPPAGSNLVSSGWVQSPSSNLPKEAFQVFGTY